MNTTLALYVLFPIAILAFGMLIAVVTGRDTFMDTPGTSLAMPKPPVTEPSRSDTSEGQASREASGPDGMRSKAKAELSRKK